MTPPMVPPVTRTLPLFKRVAVGEMRAAARLLAGALPAGAKPVMRKQLDVAFGPPGAVASKVYPLPGQPAALAPLSMRKPGNVAPPTSLVLAVDVATSVAVGGVF